MPKYIYRLRSWGDRITRNKFVKETEKMVFYEEALRNNRHCISRISKDGVYFSFKEAQSALVENIKRNIESLQFQISTAKADLEEAIKLVEPPEEDNGEVR